jgi:fumarate hydratase subunit alpha
MRELDSARISETVARLCVEANRHLPQDVKGCIACARSAEPWAPACEILDRIIENYGIADRNEVAICQDTGMACVFLEIGQDVHIAGDLRAAVDAGVRKGYGEGYLRKSVVRDPLDRVNTGDNTPAMLYTELVPGDQVKITVAPKGFGSENMSQIRMLKPSDGLQGVKDFVLKVVRGRRPESLPADRRRRRHRRHLRQGRAAGQAAMHAPHRPAQRKALLRRPRARAAGKG